MVTSLTPFSFARLGLMECSRCAWALVYRSRLTTPVLFVESHTVGHLVTDNVDDRFRIVCVPMRKVLGSHAASLLYVNGPRKVMQSDQRRHGGLTNCLDDFPVMVQRGHVKFAGARFDA